MPSYREHIALIRSLQRGSPAFSEAVRRYDGFDGAEFLEFVKEHRLRPWLDPVLADPEARALLPEAVLRHLDTQSALSGARIRELIAHAAELQKELAQRDVEPLYFKGIFLGADVYGDPYRRHQSDIDLLVDRSQLRDTLEVMARLGYDTETDGTKGGPLEQRIGPMLKKPFLGRALNACTVRRGDLKIDLHCCLRVRYESALGTQELLRETRRLELGGVGFPVPSRENDLLILLLLIAIDVRRSACKAKLFLDLYLTCLALEPDWSWETFFEARRRQGFEKIAVNMCALLLELWDCAEELPELAIALDRRSSMLEVMSSEHADAIMAQPRKHPANLALHRHLYFEAKPFVIWQRLTTDLPHTLARLSGSKRSTLRFSAS